MFENIKNSKEYNFKGYIQLSGKAKGSALKELLRDIDTYSVEIAKESAAMGLYWKLEDYNN